MARSRLLGTGTGVNGSSLSSTFSEMTLLRSVTSRRRGSANESIDGGSPILGGYSQPQAESKAEVFLRSTGLSLLWYIWCRAKGRRMIEKPKQAVRAGRAVSWMSFIPHVFPIGGAIALLWFNLHGYYIGGELAGTTGSAEEDNLKLAVLQFTAKLHEIMMQASIALVVTTFLRQELIFGGGLPFGALAGSIQMTTLGYLWSKEFGGVLKARFRSGWVKFKVVLLLLFGCVLFVTVGPSSAIAMRPRLDTWPAGGTYFYLNATRGQIWPQPLDQSHVPPNCNNISLSTDCISKDWTAISTNILPFWPTLTDGEIMPENIKIASRKSMKTLNIRLRVSQFKATWTLATIQMSNLADAISDIALLWLKAANPVSDPPKKYSYSRRFKDRKDVTWAIRDIYQPLTMAICLTNTNVSLEDIAQGRIYAPILDNFCDWDENREPLDYYMAEVPALIGSNLATSMESNESFPVLQFAELPEDSFKHSTIGAFIGIPASWPGGLKVLACGLDSRWVTAYVQGRRNAVKDVIGDHAGWPGLGTCHVPEAKKIKVSREWADLLNPYIVDHDRTVFQELASTISAAGEWIWQNNYYLEPMMESVLSVWMTNGLAAILATKSPVGLLKGCQDESTCTRTCSDGDGVWCNNIMPKNPFGYSEEPIFDLPPGADTSNMTRFVVKFDINGYAYNSRGSSSTLSLVVLVIYCVFAVGHMVLSLINGLTSFSWDTISEIMAIAMQSHSTSLLRNTCAGIVSTTVFTHMVTVVKTGENGDHLELQFDEAVSDATKVVPNEFYD